MRLVAAAVLAALVFVGGATADSTRGVLDPTFGVAGQAVDRTPVDAGGDHARLLQAANGSLYAVSLALTPGSSTTNGLRLGWFKADGTPIDRRTLDFPDLNVFSVDDATLAPNGDIIVIGNGYDPAGNAKGGIVWDITPSLSPRQSFGTNGVAIIAPAGDLEADVVGVQPNGDIVVGCDSLRSPYNDQVFVLSPAGAKLQALARDSFSGKFSAAGVAPNGDVVLGSVTGDSTIHLWLQTPGSVVPFTPSPVAVPAFVGSAVIADLDQIAFTADGSIVVGGTMESVEGNFNPNLAPGTWAMRLTPQGALDPSFGQGGAAIQLSHLDDGHSALAVEADGSIVSAVDSLGGVRVSRVLADGTPDPSFGSTVPLPATGSWAFTGTTDMVVQPNGRLVTLSFFDGETASGVVLTGFTSGPPDSDLAFGPAPPQTLEEAGAWGTPAAYTPPPAIDDDADATVTCTPALGTLLWPGTTTVTCTAVDSDDVVSAVTTFPLTVSDTTPPRVNVPQPIVREAYGPKGDVVSFTANAADAVDGGITPSCTPAPGSLFPVGTTTVTCTATDKAGNTGSASFTVTIRDTTPPQITTPLSPLVVEATGPAGAPVSYYATAVDTVDGFVPVTCDPATGTTLAIGSHTVSCSASDSTGNVAHASFQVVVRDTTPPSLQLPSSLTVDATSPAGAAVTFAATAQDLVDGAVAPTCAPASGATIAIGTTTVQCTATDSHGNEAHGTFDVTVEGASQQLADVATYVAANAIGPGTSLGAKLQAAQGAVAANDTPTACGSLRAFSNEANALAGKKLTQDQAGRLVGDAARVRSVLGC